MSWGEKQGIRPKNQEFAHLIKLERGNYKCPESTPYQKVLYR